MGAEVEEPAAVEEETKQPAKRGRTADKKVETVEAAKKVEAVEAEELQTTEAKKGRGKEAEVFVEEPQVEEKPKRGGRKKAAVVETEEPATEEVPKKGRGRAKKTVESEPFAVAEEMQETSSPVKPRGRAAAKKASDKTKSDLDDMSNLNKKKRRPSKPLLKVQREKLNLRRK